MVLRKEHARRRRGLGHRDLARSETDLSVERRRREQRNPGAETQRRYRGREFWSQRPQCRAVPLDSSHGGGFQGQRLYRRSRYRKAHPEVQADLGRATIGGLPGAPGTTTTIASSSRVGSTKEGRPATLDGGRFMTTFS